MAKRELRKQTYTVKADLVSIDSPIGDGYHNYGFDYNGLVRVVRAFRRPGTRRCASVRITTARGDVIDIDTSPRKMAVSVNGKVQDIAARQANRQAKKGAGHE